MKLKKVNYVISVPDGDYCWPHKASYNPIDPSICPHFDNTGGHSQCELGFWQVKDTPDGVLKADQCQKLRRTE